MEVWLVQRRGGIGAKRYKADEIISKLREAEVLLAEWVSVGEAVQRPGVVHVTYHRLRKEYGGMKIDQAKRSKDLQKESDEQWSHHWSERQWQMLKRLLADAELDKGIFKEVASGNW